MLFVFGLGYSAGVAAAQLRAAGWAVAGTGRGGAIAFGDDAAVRRALARAGQVLSAVPPAVPPVLGGGDPVLDRYGDALAGRALTYLSSTGVYGDCAGAWIDETAPVTGRRAGRNAADAAWLARGARVLRLPGIYGPGRSAFDRLAAGQAQRIDAGAQVFSRIHVDDLARGIAAALTAPPGAYNLADDLPASQADVIAEACRLTGRAVPPPVALAAAALSPEARAFYSESRRIATGRAARVLGWRPRYPSYREGLAAILARSAMASPISASATPPPASSDQR